MIDFAAGDDQVAVDTIKTLAMDAVQRASSGHPGMPMGMADAATVLWSRFLVVDPNAPAFPNRDRFVLSAGHGSMLLYGLLHLSGFDLSLDEIKRFRQLGSLTAGHPEVGLAPGVETTTGPLGQGFANGVGMAMAEAYLAEMFNRPGFDVVDHHTYVICSDGDLQEGISHEASSLAGHLGLGKLVYLYDDNRITIDGSADLSFTDDTTRRFEAYGWHVEDVDGHDRGAVAQAIEAARLASDRPSLVRCRTHIGHGSPNKQDTAASHGAPLGVDEIRLTKERMGWDAEAEFLVPTKARATFEGLRQRGKRALDSWNETFSRYAEAHPDLAARWAALHEGDGLPTNLDGLLPGFDGDEARATRAASGMVINALADALPTLWGGSADLSGSNKTLVSGQEPFSQTARGGRNLHFGVREHAMAAIMNGMALHGGIIPYGGTFLTFSDYMRGAMRLSALMGQRAIYVLSHDSIFLGEDGPTHQSVEHAMALRRIPGMHVIRPADTRETSAAWAAALRRTDGPTCLLLTRQGLPALPGTARAIEGVRLGGYVVHGDPGSLPQLILIGTGSELHLCTEAAAALEAEGISTRVVSMPCIERFLSQPGDYRDGVLPESCPVRLSVEAGSTAGWESLVGPFGSSIGIDRFGESAPATDLAPHFGFTSGHVFDEAKTLLGAFRQRADAYMTNLQRALERLS